MFEYLSTTRNRTVVIWVVVVAEVCDPGVGLNW